MKNLILTLIIVLVVNFLNCYSTEHFCVPHVFTGNLDFCLGEEIEGLKKLYKPNRGGFIETIYYLRFDRYDYFNSIYFHADFFGKKVAKIALDGYGESILQSDSLALKIIKLLIHEYGNNFTIKECNIGMENDILPVLLWKIKGKGYIIFRYCPIILFEKKIVSDKNHNYELTFTRQLDAQYRDYPESKKYTKISLHLY